MSLERVYELAIIQQRQLWSAADNLARESGSQYLKAQADAAWSELEALKDQYQSILAK